VKDGEQWRQGHKPASLDLVSTGLTESSKVALGGKGGRSGSRPARS
jgi:hypothetical protein